MTLYLQWKQTWCWTKWSSVAHVIYSWTQIIFILIFKKYRMNSLNHCLKLILCFKNTLFEGKIECFEFWTIFKMNESTVTFKFTVKSICIDCIIYKITHILNRLTFSWSSLNSLVLIGELWKILNDVTWLRYQHSKWTTSKTHGFDLASWLELGYCWESGWKWNEKKTDTKCRQEC